MIELGGQVIAIHLHPEVLVLCLGLIAAYVGMARRHGALMAPSVGRHGVSLRQGVLFGLGVLTFWIASGSPLHDIAERYLYSAHMVQHLLQAFVAPPLLLLGIPGWMGEVLLRPRWVRAPLQMLARPLVAGAAFNVVLLLIHWPSVVDAMVVNEVFHGASHVLLISAALLMWLPLLSPAPALIRRIARTTGMIYLFLMTILPTVPASFLVFGDEPLYRAYEAFPRLWGLSAAADMQIAGLIMKIGAGFLLWGIIVVMFFRWAAEQERADGTPSSFSGKRPEPTHIA